MCLCIYVYSVYYICCISIYYYYSHVYHKCYYSRSPYIIIYYILLSKITLWGLPTFDVFKSFICTPQSTGYHVSFSQPVMKMPAFSELYPKISPIPWLFLSSPRLHVIYIYFYNLLAKHALLFLFYPLCIYMGTKFIHAYFFPASIAFEFTVPV